MINNKTLKNFMLFISVVPPGDSSDSNSALPKETLYIV